MSPILATASQPHPDLLSPPIPPLNEEKGISRKCENFEYSLGNRIGSRILRGFACSTHDPVAFHFPDVLQTNCFVWRRKDTNTSLKRHLRAKEVKHSSRKTRTVKYV